MACRSTSELNNGLKMACLSCQRDDSAGVELMMYRCINDVLRVCASTFMSEVLEKI